MNISKGNAERLKEIAEEMAVLLEEYKNIARGAMTGPEQSLFRYNTLAHLEPGLISGSTWVVGSHVKSLEDIAENAIEDATEECEDCGQPIDECECEEDDAAGQSQETP